MNLPRQGLQKVHLALGMRLVSHSYAYVWVRDLKPGGRGRGSSWHVLSRPQTQNGVLGRARTCLCRFTGKTGELRNDLLIQSVLSEFEKIRCGYFDKEVLPLCRTWIGLLLLFDIVWTIFLVTWGVMTVSRSYSIRVCNKTLFSGSGITSVSNAGREGLK